MATDGVSQGKKGRPDWLHPSCGVSLEPAQPQWEATLDLCGPVAKSPSLAELSPWAHLWA